MGTHEQPVALEQGNVLNMMDLDPNVTVPPSVRAASAAAEAAYKAAYPDPHPANPASPAQAAPAPQETAPQPTAPQPTAPQHAAPQVPEVPSQADLQSDSWAQKYNSMRGRYEASTRQNGALQEQMNQLADELTRAQTLLAQVQAVPHHANPTHHEKLITPQDVDTYGQELIDVTRRAALDAVKPELDTLRAENETLKKRQIVNDQKGIYPVLNQRVPGWPAINNSQEFHNWLRLPNVYTHEVRKTVLDRAFASADAPAVVQVFQDFVNEVKAAGGVLPGAQTEQLQTQAHIGSSSQAPQNNAPLTLESLAAPGRARPSGGDTPAQTADKPIYSRQDIANFYANVRKGLYRGRPNDQSAIERDLEAAQREGRIR